MSAVVLGGYANSFQVPFLFDDVPNISHNLSLHFKDFSLERVKELIGQNYNNSIRIFAYLTFALNYYFGGLNVFGYHLVNVLIHLSSGLLLYWFLLLTLNLPFFKECYGFRAFPLALFSSLLFLSHPVQTQSVTYIVQRMASMGSMFYLLGLVLYVKGRLSSGKKRYLCWTGMTLIYPLGIFTKENVAILPLFIALYEFYFFQNVELTPNGKRFLACVCGAVLLTGLLILLIWGERYYDVILQGYKIRDFTLTERVLTQFRVVLYYLTLLLYPAPSRLNLDYDFPISKGFFDPWTTMVSILIIAGLIGYGIWVARRSPLVSYFVLWFFGNLVIESSIFPLEMVYEHRLYLPMVGPVVLFVVGVARGWEWLRKRWGIRTTERRPLWVFFCCLTFLSVIGSYQRNLVWKNEISLWRDVVTKSPNKARSYNNLGTALIDADRPDEAVPVLERAISLKPENPEAYYNLGNIYLIYRQNYNIAISFFTKTIMLEPGFVDAYINLAGAYNRIGRYDEAVRLLERVKRKIAGRVGGHFNLAVAYVGLGDIDAAMRELERVRKIDPHMAQELEAYIHQLHGKGW